MWVCYHDANQACVCVSSCVWLWDLKILLTVQVGCIILIIIVLLTIKNSVFNIWFCFMCSHSHYFAISLNIFISTVGSTEKNSLITWTLYYYFVKNKKSSLIIFVTSLIPLPHTHTPSQPQTHTHTQALSVFS